MAKFLPLISLCVASLCYATTEIESHVQLTKENWNRSQEIIERWGVLGKSAEDARQIMEKHGFKCSSVSNDGTTPDSILLSSHGVDDGSRWFNVLKFHCAVVFTILNGKVTEISVFGPGDLSEPTKKQMEAQVARWVPIGTSMPEVYSIMRTNGFDTKLDKTSALGYLPLNIDYLSCEYYFESDFFDGIEYNDWKVRLLLAKGRVAAVDVNYENGSKQKSLYGYSFNDLGDETSFEIHMQHNVPVGTHMDDASYEMSKESFIQTKSDSEVCVLSCKRQETKDIRFGIHFGAINDKIVTVTFDSKDNTPYSHDMSGLRKSAETKENIKKEALAIVKKIPRGANVKQAKALLQKNGFDCSIQAFPPMKQDLSALRYVFPSGYFTGAFLHIADIYPRDGKVAQVKTRIQNIFKKD